MFAVLIIIYLDVVAVSLYHSILCNEACHYSLVRNRINAYQYVHNTFRRNNYTTLNKWISKDPNFRPITYAIGDNIKWNNMSVCRNDSFFLLMYFVRKDDLARRSVIREFVKQNMIVDGKKINYVFVVASPLNATNQIKELTNENALYGDILISLHEDNYRLVPITILDAFYWVREYCKTVSFVARIDGDVWVHLGNLIHYYKSLDERRVFSGIMQVVHSNGGAVWYKGIHNIPYDYSYPVKHVAGGAYVLSRDVVPFINIGANYMSVLLPISEDVMITDILSKAGIELHPCPQTICCLLTLLAIMYSQIILYLSIMQRALSCLERFIVIIPQYT